ncbi:chemotaxis protein CheW [Paucibacter soli]|uniref:chemotaxis protein CheW n=1 Tax=Paucibacter soli TaxID=3133433 RepID=UPI0030A5405F
MMHSSSLVELQRNLIAAAARPDAAQPGPMYMPFESAGQLWVVKCSDVARLAIPSEVTSLQGYAGSPDCVLGVISADGELLTVVDVSLLFGAAATVRSLKSRLIVCADGSLKGIALMVDRVRDRVESLDDLAGATLLDPESLYARLSKKAGRHGENI